MEQETYTPVDFGQAVRAFRKQRAWTQQELAEWLGTSRQTVISLEAGGPVGLDIAFRALALLGAKAVIKPKGAREATAQ